MYNNFCTFVFCVHLASLVWDVHILLYMYKKTPTYSRYLQHICTCTPFIVTFTCTFQLFVFLYIMVFYQMNVHFLLYMYKIAYEFINFIVHVHLLLYICVVHLLISIFLYIERVPKCNKKAHEILAEEIMQKYP